MFSFRAWGALCSLFLCLSLLLTWTQAATVYIGPGTGGIWNGECDGSICASETASCQIATATGYDAGILVNASCHLVFLPEATIPWWRMTVTGDYPLTLSSSTSASVSTTAVASTVIDASLTTVTVNKFNIMTTTFFEIMAAELSFMHSNFNFSGSGAARVKDFTYLSILNSTFVSTGLYPTFSITSTQNPTVAVNASVVDSVFDGPDGDYAFGFTNGYTTSIISNLSITGSFLRAKALLNPCGVVTSLTDCTGEQTANYTSPLVGVPFVCIPSHFSFERCNLSNKVGTTNLLPLNFGMESLYLNKVNTKNISLGGVRADETVIISSTIDSGPNPVDYLNRFEANSVEEPLVVLENVNWKSPLGIVVYGPSPTGCFRIDSINTTFPEIGNAPDWTFKDRICLEQPLSLEKMGTLSESTITFFGEALEIRGGVQLSPEGGATLNVTSRLRVWEADLQAYIYPPEGHLTFSPRTNQSSTGINIAYVSSDIQYIEVDWNLRRLGVPEVNRDYKLLVGDPTGIDVYSLDPQFNITGKTDTTPYTLFYVFNPVECNPDCENRNMSAFCVSIDFCPCAAPWDGPYCDCNKNGLPAGASCGKGENWYTDEDFEIDEDDMFFLPLNYSYYVDGDFDLDGELDMSEGSEIFSTGVFVQNGTLNGVCRLLENRTGDGCVIYSTISVQSQSLRFYSISKVNLVLDVSQLTTDGSCIPPSIPKSHLDLPSVESIFTSLTGTTMAPDALWNITVVVADRDSDDSSEEEEKRRDSWTAFDAAATPTPAPERYQNLKINTTLLNSRNIGESSGTSTRLHSSGPTSQSCSSFMTSPGQLSLFISPCEPVTPEETTTKKSGRVLWWYYTIPIIALVAIVVIVLVTVFTVPAIREKVLPYHNS